MKEKKGRTALGLATLMATIIYFDGDIQIIAAIAGLLKPFVVKYFCKIVRRHIGKLGIAKILHVYKT